MPVPTIAGNWKMNTTVHDAVRLATEVRDNLRTSSGVDIILCPPYIALQQVRDAVIGSPIKVGAQNMHFEYSGAFTGEIGPLMLQGLCDYVILGHSERRQLFGETDEAINRKVKAAFSHSLRPILCVGETLEQREAGRAGAVVAQQLREDLSELHDITGLLVAYEPVWAIGTGQAATPEIAAEIMGGTVQASLTALFGAAADDVPVLYGGSVNAENVGSYLRLGAIHGALVGGASLQADQFLRIIQETATAKL